jgi:hypothetical protein
MSPAETAEAGTDDRHIAGGSAGNAGDGSCSHVVLPAAKSPPRHAEVPITPARLFDRYPRFEATTDVCREAVTHGNIATRPVETPHLADAPWGVRASATNNWSAICRLVRPLARA